MHPSTSFVLRRRPAHSARRQGAQLPSRLLDIATNRAVVAVDRRCTLVVAGSRAGRGGVGRCRVERLRRDDRGRVCDPQRLRFSGAGIRCGAQFEAGGSIAGRCRARQNCAIQVTAPRTPTMVIVSPKSVQPNTLKTNTVRTIRRPDRQARSAGSSWISIRSPRCRSYVPLREREGGPGNAHRSWKA